MADPDFEKRRRQRNIGLALALAGFVVVFFAVTIVKLQGLS
ncbi:hypothetical protein JCM17844_09150 [Iodidimonas gelatinilytica]|uniref:Cytochrome C oxidase assembly protein n=2 Tax=Iodidimonas TaxID=2066486 RepID=A0A5A7MUV2_9PROT|nr:MULTISPECIES: hypothetical protein [Iodidimonas]GEQ97278.1 hypothetical protein JCM17844_09150 [Iodidimonas gelatinilytica]GEQ99606.1 hypothetical protein JCM17845_02300 [Iodidimonas gelatinilytica]GER07287.1 hypothetical protein JCM17843_15970 [Kordiimonadales bacterium JCM 17843]GGO11109.1 hypothetical protein GCM10007972_14640 [Iodidimonas muriae]